MTIPNSDTTQPDYEPLNIKHRRPSDVAREVTLLAYATPGFSAVSHRAGTGAPVVTVRRDDGVLYEVTATARRITPSPPMEPVECGEGHPAVTVGQLVDALVHLHRDQYVMVADIDDEDYGNYGRPLEGAQEGVYTALTPYSGELTELGEDADPVAPADRVLVLLPVV